MVKNISTIQAAMFRDHWEQIWGSTTKIMSK